MVLHRTLSAVVVLACLSAAVAMGNEESQRNPAGKDVPTGTLLGLLDCNGLSQVQGRFIDTDGLGRIHDHLNAKACIVRPDSGSIRGRLCGSQSYGCYIDPWGFGAIPENVPTSQL